MNRYRLLAIGGLSLLAIPATALAAGVSGNRQGIALARAQQRAYSKVTAVSVTQTGFAAMRDQEGRTSFFAWAWGNGVVPRGFAKATEHEILGLRGGRVAWWRDDLTPAPCTAPGLCSRIPVELVGERSGRFFAFGSASRHTCFSPLNGSIPDPVGALFARVFGRFRAPVHHGGSVRLTYTYPWFRVAKRPANETDTLSSRTLLNQFGRVSVARGPGRGRPAFTFKFSESYPANSGAPRINRCKA